MDNLTGGDVVTLIHQSTHNLKMTIESINPDGYASCVYMVSGELKKVSIHRYNS